MMDNALRIARYVLRFGWILPVAWVLSGGPSGALGVVVLPVYLYLGYGLIWVFAHDRVRTWVGRSRVRRLAAGTAMAASAASAVKLTALAINSSATLGDLVLNGLVLCILAMMITVTLSWDFSFESVQEDFRIGIIATTLVLAEAFATGHASHLRSPLAYVGVVGYGVVGLVALMFARRYSPDLLSNDKRTVSIDVDWLLGLVVMLGIVGAVSLVLVQILGLDVVGGMGSALRPAWSEVAAVVAAAGGAIVRFIVWIISFLHFKVPKPHLPPKQPPAPPATPTPGHIKKHSAPAPLWFTDTVKAIGLAIVVGIGLLALNRSLNRFRPRPGLGTTRVRAQSWSLSGLLSWVFGQTKLGIGDFAASHRPNFRRRSFKSVRDVYRALLADAASVTRSRRLGETALEYSSALVSRWPGTKGDLDQLNTLYMDERYGRNDSPPEVVAKALGHLRSVEAVIHRE